MGEPETRGPPVCTCTSYPLCRGGGGENRVGGEVWKGGRGVEGRVLGGKGRVGGKGGGEGEEH